MPFLLSSLSISDSRTGHTGAVWSGPSRKVYCTFSKMSYTLWVEIVIRPSAHTHLITDEEMRAVIAYPALRVGLAPRRVNTAPVLFIGPAADNQPWLEVIADLIDPNVAEVFHAMMLRSGLIARLGLDSLMDPDYGPQRA